MVSRSERFHAFLSAPYFTEGRIHLSQAFSFKESRSLTNRIGEFAKGVFQLIGSPFAKIASFICYPFFGRSATVINNQSSSVSEGPSPTPGGIVVPSAIASSTAVLAFINGAAAPLSSPPSSSPSTSEDPLLAIPKVPNPIVATASSAAAAATTVIGILTPPETPTPAPASAAPTSTMPANDPLSPSVDAASATVQPTPLNVAPAAVGIAAAVPPRKPKRASSLKTTPQIIQRPNYLTLKLLSFDPAKLEDSNLTVDHILANIGLKRENALIDLLKKLQHLSKKNPSELSEDETKIANALKSNLELFHVVMDYLASFPHFQNYLKLLFTDFHEPITCEIGKAFIRRGDFEKAQNWLKESASLGNSDSQSLLIQNYGPLDLLNIKNQLGINNWDANYLLLLSDKLLQNQNLQSFTLSVDFSIDCLFTPSVNFSIDCLNVAAGKGCDKAKQKIIHLGTTVLNLAIGNHPKPTPDQAIQLLTKALPLFKMVLSHDNQAVNLQIIDCHRELAKIFRDHKKDNARATKHFHTAVTLGSEAAQEELLALLSNPKELDKLFKDQKISWSIKCSYFLGSKFLELMKSRTIDSTSELKAACFNRIITAVRNRHIETPSFLNASITLFLEEASEADVMTWINVAEQQLKLTPADQYIAGISLTKNMKGGKSLKEKGRELVLASSKNQHPEGICQEGIWLLEKGETKRALPILKKAADDFGSGEAALKLGIHYSENEDRPYTEAIKYLTLASERGHPEAHHSVLSLYEKDPTHFDSL